jgi:hypothetical protein
MALADTARLVSTLELQDKFSGPAANAERSLGRMEQRFGAVGRLGDTASRGLQNTARNMAVVGAAGVAALGALVGRSIQDASNLQQAMGAVDSVFGDSADTIERWADTAGEAAGLSRRQVSEMAAVVGAQLQGMGFELEESAALTVELQQRAADLAATFGGTTEEAIQSISSLLRGERDPIEKYGVSVKQVDINARIAALGLDTSTAAAKKNAEAIAAMQLLMESTAKTEGQFARETESLAGTQQRLSANLENIRATIGTALLPQVAAVAERLNQAVTDNLPAIEGFAAKLPGIFEKLLTIVENLPWGAIGSAFQLMGTGAEAALTAFAGAPSWLQTAVLTGWGLNKLTGGALGSIVSQLAGGLVKGVLGMNAGVVNINAATVNGGGGLPGGAAGGAGGLLRGAATGAAVGLGVGAAAIAAVEVVNFETMRAEQREGLQGILDELPRGASTIDESIERLESEINKERPILEGVLFNTNVRPQLEDQLRELQQVKASQERGNSAARDAIPWAIRNADEVRRLNESEGTRFGNLYGKVDGTNSILGQVRTHESVNGGILAQIRDKKPAQTLTKLNVTTNVYVSAAQVTTESSSYRETVGGYEPR